MDVVAAPCTLDIGAVTHFCAVHAELVNAMDLPRFMEVCAKHPTALTAHEGLCILIACQ
jgi:hypothetical protein